MCSKKYKCLPFKVIEPDNFLISDKIKLIEYYEKREKRKIIVSLTIQS